MEHLHPSKMQPPAHSRYGCPPPPKGHNLHQSLFSLKKANDHNPQSLSHGTSLRSHLDHNMPWISCWPCLSIHLMALLLLAHCASGSRPPNFPSNSSRNRALHLLYKSFKAITPPPCKPTGKLCLPEKTTFVHTNSQLSCLPPVGLIYRLKKESPQSLNISLSIFSTTRSMLLYVKVCPQRTSYPPVAVHVALHQHLYQNNGSMLLPVRTERLPRPLKNCIVFLLPCIPGSTS